jgi:preprotein translocase subunit SecA
LRHFETQLMAGYYLHQEKLSKWKQAKENFSFYCFLNALSKEGVHVVTVNDYLAERDQKWMGKVYKGLGLDVGLVKVIVV